MSAGCITRADGWCCRKDSNLHRHGSRPCASADCATTAWMWTDADGEIRTLNLLFLRQAPLPFGLRRRERELAAEVGFEPTSLGSEPSCLPLATPQ